MDADFQLSFVGPDQAATVRELMLAAFAEYEGVLTVPSSAMWETVEDVASHIAQGGAVLVHAAGQPIASGRFEIRDDHVYIGRLSVLPEFRSRGIAARMMEAMESRGAEAGRSEARISVRTLLPRNIQLYERLGYVVTATYKHERGDEVIVDMAKRLASGEQA
jgi:ribosomal protein S18 acetylase RimI-like enzyme